MKVNRLILLVLLLSSGCLFSQNKLERYSDSLIEWQLRNPIYLETSQEFLRLAHESKDEEYLGRANHFLASYQLFKSDYDSARYFLFEGLQYETSFKGRLLLSVGLSYCWEENYVLGFDYLQQSIPFLKDQPVRSARAYNNMAICLKVQKDFEGARVYYRLAKQIQHQRENTEGEASITLNMALSFSPNKTYDSVYLYLNKALILARESKSNLTLSAVYSAFAGLNNQLSKPKVALEFVDSAKYYCNRLERKDYRMAGILIHEGAANLANKDFRNFKRALEELELLVPKVRSDEIRSHYLMNRHILAKHQGNYKLALEMYSASIELKDSLYNGEKFMEISNMKHSLELSEKEREKLKLNFRAEYLEKKRIKDEIEISSKSNKLILALVGLALLLIIVVLIFNLYRKNKIQMVLAGKNEQLAQERVAQKELLIGEIHHRIKNNLQLISSMLFIEANQSENVEVKKSLEMASNRLQSIGHLHKSLYSKDSYTEVDMEEFVLDLVKTIGASYSALEVEHQMDVESNLIDVDAAITIGLILNELITNAYKYAFQIGANNQLGIVSKVELGVLYIQLKDSGKTPIETSNASSFGFKLIRTLVKQMKGTIHFDYQDGNQINIEIRKLKLLNEN